MTQEHEVPPKDTPGGPESPGEGSEQPAIRRWTSALVIAIILASVYLIALYLTGRGDTVPPPKSPTTAPAAVADGFRPLSITFLDERHGLISGSARCAACPGQRGGVIASTSDGGGTWSVRFRGERPIVGLTRIGQTSDVWATATTCDNESFIGCDLFRVHSSDLGQTWHPDKPKDPSWVSPPGNKRSCNPDHPYPVSSSFVTLSRGWMLCAERPTSGTYQFKGLFETTDAGRRWVQRAHFHAVTGGATTNRGNLPIDGFAGGISFLKDGMGWLWTVGPYSSLSASSDGGDDWRVVWRPSDTSGRQIVAASLTASETGLMVVRSPGPGYWLLVTHDAGRSWDIVQSWPAPPRD